MKKIGMRRGVAVVAVGIAALVVVPFALAAATNSTTDPGVAVGSTTSGDCLHPADLHPVNCNLYAQKEDVFLNGSPSKTDAGTYFFAVLVPGGQPNPNDGDSKNLSDSPGGYAADNREFTVDAAGNLTPLVGPDFQYAFDQAGNSGMGSLSVFPFDDTTNNGGVYILATCKISDSLANAYVPDPTAGNGDCKYDAFKVKPSGTTTPPASGATVTKDAAGAYTDTFTWGIQKDVDKTEIDDSTGSATFNYTVAVTHDGPTVSGVTVSGIIQVFNPNVDSGNNTTPMTLSGVTDQLSDGTNCTVDTSGGLILTDLETDYPYTCSLSALPAGELDNTATVSWLQQTVNGQPLAAGSANFTFSTVSFTAKNVDDCADVSDTLGGPLGTVCSGDPSPKTFTYPITFTGDPAGTCTQHDNMASFKTNTSATTGSASQSVEQCVGEDLQVQKTATPAFKRTIGWSVAKSVDKTTADIASGGSATFNYTVTATHDSGTESAWQVTGMITVSNPNDWESIPLTDVTDAIDHSGNCSITSGSTTATLAPKGQPGDSTTLDYKCTFDTNPGSGTNTATASWDAATAFTPDGSSQGTHAYDFGSVNPTILDNCTDVKDTFNGGAADDLGMVCADGSSSGLNQSLANFSAVYSAPTWTFTYSRTVSGVAGTCTKYDNTASFKTADTSATGSFGPVEVTVCVGKDLTVAKTASPSFTRTYNWAINKSVDKTTVSTSGSSATFNYTVVVNQTGVSDSAIQATGTITVTNPNDWESVTLSNVTDAVNNSGSCSITSGSTTATLAPKGMSGDSTVLGYTCTYASVPANGTNTATASWDPAAAFTPHGSATGTAAVTFGAPTTSVNKTITPTDAFNGGLGVNLCTLTSPANVFCTLTGHDSSPFTSHTYNYSRTIPAPASGCANFTNTAATGTGPTSSKTVSICKLVAGALTMGFWQNNNGQAIVKGDASTAAVCNVGTWLRQYAPFQDLGISATCAQVATYVYNTIKGGGVNCGGSSCNALLKAQMLATALDVYFSTPGLGGNKIGAPAPLGGINVNTTSWSAAFGGSTCLSISQMLSFAASQSNVGGSSWYLQVKATQVLAQTAFNAINNDQAVTC